MMMNPYQQRMQDIAPTPHLLADTARRMTEAASKPRLRRWAPCLAGSLAAVAVGAAWLGHSQPLPQQPAPTSPMVTLQAASPAVQLAESLTVGQHQAHVQLSQGELNFSEGLTLADAMPVPQKDWQWQTWDWNQTCAYLGWDFRPRWVPPDLAMPQDDPAFQVAVNGQGQVILNAFGLTYAENISEEYQPLRRQVTVEVGKGGPPDQCALYWPDTQVPSWMGDVPVQVGHCGVTYGPYDPVTHAPSGTFDRYVAEFTMNGLGFVVVSDNLTQQEFIQTLISWLDAPQKKATP